MSSAELYQAIVAAEIPYTNHYSDLYVKRTPESEAIIAGYEFKCNVTTFRNNIDGLRWYDVPFAFQPFWDKVAERSRKTDTQHGKSEGKP